MVDDSLIYETLIPGKCIVKAGVFVTREMDLSTKKNLSMESWHSKLPNDHGPSEGPTMRR